MKRTGYKQISFKYKQLVSHRYVYCHRKIYA